MGEATLWTKTKKKRKKMTTVSRQVLMTTDQAPSEKYFLYCKNYLGFLVFSHFWHLTIRNSLNQKKLFRDYRLNFGIKISHKFV